MPTKVLEMYAPGWAGPGCTDSKLKSMHNIWIQLLISSYHKG